MIPLKIAVQAHIDEGDCQQSRKEHFEDIHTRLLLSSVKIHTKARTIAVRSIQNQAREAHSWAWRGSVKTLDAIIITKRSKLREKRPWKKVLPMGHSGFVVLKPFHLNARSIPRMVRATIVAIMRFSPRRVAIC